MDWGGCSVAQAGHTAGVAPPLQSKGGAGCSRRFGWTPLGQGHEAVPCVSGGCHRIPAAPGATVGRRRRSTKTALFIEQAWHNRRPYSRRTGRIGPLSRPESYSRGVFATTPSQLQPAGHDRRRLDTMRRAHGSELIAPFTDRPCAVPAIARRGEREISTV